MLPTGSGKKIAVLMGGRSAEREISLKSGAAVAAALKRLGYGPVVIDADEEVAISLRQERVDVAFIALHGRYGEDGGIQGLLEWMRIPYTGSGVLASALGMNKIASRKIFMTQGIAVPKFAVFTPDLPIRWEALPFGLPMVVKPVSEGSSVGVSLVVTQSELLPALKTAFQYGPYALVEEYLRGMEIHVGILGETPLGAIEICPKTAFYDYTAKYSPGMSKHIFPARLSASVMGHVLEMARQAHAALGCSGISRVDLLLNGQHQPHVLEVNTLPGMTETSLLPEIAEGVGIPFDQLVERILSMAGLDK